MKHQILFLITIISLSATAQRQMKPLYNLNDQGMKKSGWHFSPGITYVIPSKKNTEIHKEINWILRIWGHFN